MMRADASEHLCVEPAGVGLRELAQLLAEGVFTVPAGQIAMDLGQVIPLLQFGGEGPLAGRRLTERHHIGPPLLAFEHGGTSHEIVLPAGQFWGANRLGGLAGLRLSREDVAARKHQPDSHQNGREGEKRHACHETADRSGAGPVRAKPVVFRAKPVGVRAKPGLATRREGDDGH